MKILLPVDGSEHSGNAVALAKKLSGLFDHLDVVVLYVMPRPITLDQAMKAGVGLDYRRYEEGFAEWGRQVLKQAVAALDLPAESVVERLSIGHPAEVIVDIADDEGVDFIVIGARGESTIHALLLGSTTHKVLQLAACPVLVAR